MSVTVNARLLRAAFPALDACPIELGEPDLDAPELIRQRLRLGADSGAFREVFSEGGLLQGSFESYSTFSYWRPPVHPRPKGSVAVVPAAFLFVSHLAPVACLGFGDGVWTRRGHGLRHPAAPVPVVGEPLRLSAEPEPGEDWLVLAAAIETKLRQCGYLPIDVDSANAPLPAGSAEGYVYLDGLELPPPRLVKDLLFHEGVDFSY